MRRCSPIGASRSPTVDGMAHQTQVFSTMNYYVYVDVDKISKDLYDFVSGLSLFNSISIGQQGGRAFYINITSEKSSSETSHLSFTLRTNYY